MNRIHTLAQVIRNGQGDAMLLTGEINLIYAINALALEGCLLILKDETALFITDGRYTEVAEQFLKPEGVTVLTRSPQHSELFYLKQLLAQHHVEKLLFEDDVLTVQQFAQYEKALSCEFLPVSGQLHALRSIKAPEEIAQIITAQRIAEQAFSKLLSQLCEGMTEKDAAALLNYHMAACGSEKPSFETILLFGENTSKPHGVPSNRPLRRGDFILADFGAVSQGYHSDMTRTLAFGSATEEMRRVYETVLQAQEAAAKQAHAGIPCREMHLAAQRVIEEAGYGEAFTHALGHSVGLEIHESPVAAPRSQDTLTDGIVMTDEPGIYLAGKFGVRIEDMLVIQGDKPLNLTQFPKEFTILSPTDSGSPD